MADIEKRNQIKKSTSLHVLRNFRYMVRIKLLFLLLVAGQWLSAQTSLIVQGTSPDLYLLHTVEAKENWYSIGRLYNLSPRELAPYNKTSLDKPLSIGQQIRVPLTSGNFSQNGTKATDETFVPVYHLVQEKEGMYRVSVNHNKVSMDNLKKWNALQSDQLNNGMKLIVGYLKVKEGQSAIAAHGTGTVAGNATDSKNIPQEKSVTTTVANNDQAVVKKDDAVVKTQAPAVTKEEPVVTKEEPATRVEQVKNTGAPADYKGGFFRSQYDNSGKTVTGNAATFKSTSGWEDGKYYALMNNVPIGTIIKVTFSSTNKSIYAKVLGQLPEMRESAGLTLRLSDAAASELGVSISKFYVDVKF